MGMNTIELAYQYMRGDIGEDVIISILGEPQAANIVSLSKTLTHEEVNYFDNKHYDKEEKSE